MALLLEQALQLPAAIVSPNKPYLPLPNRVEVVLTDELAPEALTKTAFMLPVRRDGALIMAQNRRRALEFAGGHIEAGETAEEGARRECHEETGYLVKSVVPIGFLRMISEGEAPEGYGYPHPVSFQQFFAGIVHLKDTTFAPTDECDWPQQLNAAEVRERLSASRYAFYEAALRNLVELNSVD